MFPHGITSDEVKTVIDKLKGNNSSGDDEIDRKVVN